MPTKILIRSLHQSKPWRRQSFFHRPI